MRRRAAPILSILLAMLVLLPSCELTGGTGDSRPMGSGQTCHRRLSAVVDEDFLLAEGLEIKDADLATVAVGGVIAEVCMDGPSSISVDQGAERVADVIRSRL